MHFAETNGAEAKSSKFQTPRSKKAPGPKHQTPSSKLQRSSKRWPRFGAWNLGFLWCLEFGFWCFEIWNFSGAWGLVLGVSIAPVPTLTAALTSGPAGV